MYKGQKKFDREQLVFIVDVMVTSALEGFTNTFPAKYMSGTVEAHGNWIKQWNEVPDEVEPQGYIADSLWQLGWNLSILYAQLTSDGMGEGDALSGFAVDLDKEIRTWAMAWAKGERGIVPSGDPEQGAGTFDTPNSRKLAEVWVDDVFKDYLIE